MTPSEEWTRCKPWIEAALEYDGGFYTIEDVEAELAAERAIFWPGKKSAVVAQIWNFPRQKALHYWLAGGDLDELLIDMRPEIEAFAKAAGCTDIIMAGRKGWVRTMRKYGYQDIWTALRKEL